MRVVGQRHFQKLSRVLHIMKADCGVPNSPVNRSHGVSGSELQEGSGWMAEGQVSIFVSVLNLPDSICSWIALWDCISNSGGPTVWKSGHMYIQGIYADYKNFQSNYRLATSIAHQSSMSHNWRRVSGSSYAKFRLGLLNWVVMGFLMTKWIRCSAQKIIIFQGWSLEYLYYMMSELAYL